MTRPAEVTSRTDWADLVDAINNVVSDISALRADTTNPMEEPTMPDPERSPVDREAEYDTDRRRRLDYETDLDLDGDVDPAIDETDLDLEDQ